MANKLKDNTVVQLEIERKFLLRQLPDVKWNDILSVDQFYHKNQKNYWDRYRKLESKISNKNIFQHTIKKTVSKGINQETETPLSREEFEVQAALCFSSNKQAKYISKVRHIIIIDDLKWEVDLFLNQTGLIIAEIEIPTLDYPLEIPDFIKENLIMEVTDYKQFSNRSIAKIIEKEIKKAKRKSKKAKIVKKVKLLS